MFGSSPRLRGTRWPDHASRSCGRFIPAPAGNAQDGPAVPAVEAVHPRACGERRPLICATLTERGSSPRLRGTRGEVRLVLAEGRFIPAPAGNALHHSSRRFAISVHPRACGERRTVQRSVWLSIGSSPRLRGTRGWPCSWPTQWRFIPAPAGNAFPRTVTPGSLAVHPRACGERALPVAGRPRLRGSSPRLRGTRRRGGRNDKARRFIPAPAGNAPHRAQTLPRNAVHPRACGERALASNTARAKPGSSPRLRGTPYL